MISLLLHSGQPSLTFACTSATSIQCLSFWPTHKQTEMAPTADWPAPYLENIADNEEVYNARLPVYGSLCHG